MACKVIALYMTLTMSVKYSTHLFEIQKIMKQYIHTVVFIVPYNEYEVIKVYLNYT